MDMIREGGVAEGVRISMDGKGRAIHNVFVERFWHTLKPDHLCLTPSVDAIDLHQSCARFVVRYNTQRKYSA